MTEKKAKMVLKVDLQCPRCYKKIQKILCKIPEITDRVFDEKANVVMITVKCCSPENIRDKLCCKGGKIIKSIEIQEPSKQKPNGKGNEQPLATDNKQEKPPPPKPTPGPPVVIVLPPIHPAKPCCGPCHEGHVGWPCYCGYGFPPQPCYGGNYGPGYVYVTRCDFFSEENPTGCTIM